MIEIRREKSTDPAAIRRVHDQAFGRRDEGKAVDALRHRKVPTLSLVAIKAEHVVGHILFSPVTLELPVDPAHSKPGGEVESEPPWVEPAWASPATPRPRPPIAEDLNLMALGPMAVLSNHQRRGVGSLLVGHGLDLCQKHGCDAVVVLGSPGFYGRFGFVPAKPFAIGCTFPVPDDAFMLIELQYRALRDRRGSIRYAPEFDALG